MQPVSAGSAGTFVRFDFCFSSGHVGTGQGHVGTSGVMLGQVRVMFVCDNFLARSLL